MDADGTTGEATCMSAAAEPAAVASAKTGMATAAVPAATTVTTAAMLRPQGQSQQNGERRNGRQTPHTASL